MTENIGRTRVQGAELDVQARVLRGTLLQSTVQYLDARNQEFVYDNPVLVGPPTTGCPVSVDAQNPSLFRIDCSGRRPTQSPEWTVTAGVEQSLSLRDGGDLKMSLRTRYQSEAYTGFELLLQQLQDSFLMSDALLVFTAPKGNFTAEAYVNNIENRGVVGFSTPHPGAPSLIVENLRAPRTYGVRLGVRL